MWFGVHCTGADGGDDKHFTDRAVCRPFLLDICISDLFTNTVRETSYLFAQSLIAALMVCYQQHGPRIHSVQHTFTSLALCSCYFYIMHIYTYITVCSYALFTFTLALVRSSAYRYPKTPYIVLRCLG